MDSEIPAVLVEQSPQVIGAAFRRVAKSDLYC